VAAAGGRPLAALSRRPGVRSVTDADHPLSVKELSPGPGVELAADPGPFGGEDSPPNPPNSAGRGVGVGVLDTGIAANGDLAGRVVASADLSGEWSFSDSYATAPSWPG
jgi:hypothetical protein